MPKLSLIMPAYNAEKTCKKAIDSVICNDYDIELIVVDDGSKDSTYKICEAIQSKDSRVKVYTKKNGGVSSARNYGLDVATGEYIGFIDSDDLLSKHYMEVLFPLMEQRPDVILFGFSNLINGKKVSASKPLKTENPKVMFEYLLFQGGCLNSPWNKLFRHSLLHNMFNIDKNMGEDLEFCCEYLKEIKTCRVISDELYFYNADTEGSLTKKTNIVLDSIVNDMNVLMNFTKEIGIGENVVADKFYQRTEGILGGIEGYNDFIKAVKYLMNKKDYIFLLHQYTPQKRKNILICDMMLQKRWKRLYGYLLCKRCARKIIQELSRK